MKEFLTYAALETTDIDFVLDRCSETARSMGLVFAVPKVPSTAAHIWVGTFPNGWMFAQADPAVWELLDVFSRVADEEDIAYLSGSTEGDYKKWCYEFFEEGEKLHDYYADPSVRFKEEEYHLHRGDPNDLEDIFGVSLFKLRQLLKQFNGEPVQSFFRLLGFELSQAKNLRFLIIEKSKQEAGQPTSSDGAPTKKGFDRGETTGAIEAIEKALQSGYAGAAAIRAERFGEEGHYSEVQELCFRLRQEGRHEPALKAATKLLKRAEEGEFNRLPDLQEGNLIATFHGLRGLCLVEVDTKEAAIQELTRSLEFNRYVGPDYRATVAGLLGDLLVQRMRYEQALDPLRLYLAEQPGDGSMWAKLALAAMRAKRKNEAKRAAQMGLGISPDLEDWGKIRIRLGLRGRDLLPAPDPASAPGLREEAHELIEEGDAPAAIEKLQLAYYNQPEDHDMAWELVKTTCDCVHEGRCQDETDDFEIVRLAEQVVFSSPSKPLPWGALIELLLKRGLEERARQAAEAYAREHVHNHEGLLALGNDLSEVAAELAIELLDILSERFVELRMRDVTSISDRDTDRQRFNACMGKAQVLADRFDEGIKSLMDAIQANSQDADSWYYLAKAHLAQDNQRAARSAITKGLRASPEHTGLTQLSEEQET